MYPSETKFSLPRIPVDWEHADGLFQVLTDVLNRRIYEEIPKEEVLHLHYTLIYPVSNAFIVTDLKLILVMKLPRQ